MKNGINRICIKVFPALDALGLLEHVEECHVGFTCSTMQAIDVYSETIIE